ncbi:MAG: S41 family peptidase [Gammaproteobacteria bacterium]
MRLSSNSPLYAKLNFFTLGFVLLAVLAWAAVPVTASAEDVAPQTDVPATGSDSPQDKATNPQQSDAAVEPSEKENQQQDVPLEKIRALVEVFHKIKNDYVEPVSDEQLLEDAMKGMLAGLDPHSNYLDGKAYQGLQEGTSGQFGGLGIEVGVEDGFVKVIAPIDDTPAARAGIQAGDLIIRLDDTPVKGIGLNQAVKRMRGKAGTPIDLTIVREGEEKPLKITVVRDLIKIQSVKSRFLEPGFLYLRVSHFQSRTSEDFKSALEKRIAENEKPLNGVILDLRNNPGGILGAAVAVSDAFLSSGKIVYTEGRVKDSQLEFNAKPPDLVNGAPLVVLINEGSASASEIVAGALQDRKRAVIMGRQSFGKGSVQTIFPMNDESALKLTTARYFTPSGRSIQAEGISPDIVIDKVTLSAIKTADENVIKEANLAGHLVGDEEEAEDEDASEQSKNSSSREKLATSDYELYEALNLLKGMVLLQARSSQ